MTRRSIVIESRREGEIPTVDWTNSQKSRSVHRQDWFIQHMGM